MITEAQSRRTERAAKKRQRELEKLLKARTRLSEMEQARLVVEAFENKLAVLLSVHRETSPAVDWFAVYSTLPPFQKSHTEGAPDETQTSEWAKKQALARRVLDGDSSGYIDALTNMSAFSELAALGESIEFSVESRRVIACELRLTGREAIPSEVPAVSPKGQLISKPMPKARFHEIYPDYVCSCVLRIGREVFALLPIDTLIVSALIGSPQGAIGPKTEGCILSVAITRETLAAMDFERLDPSDAIQTLIHRGDMTASKRRGEFTWVPPLQVEDVNGHPSASAGVDALWSRVRKMRSRIQRSLRRSKA